LSWRAGDTFTHTIFSAQPIPHLYFVISDVTEHSDRVVIVNLTSWDDRADRTCVVDIGDHPFITHKSYINYRKANLTTTRKLDEAEGKKMIFKDKPASQELLRRIQAGAHASDRTRNWIKESL